MKLEEGGEGQRRKRRQRGNCFVLPCGNFAEVLFKPQLATNQIQVLFSVHNFDLNL